MRLARRQFILGRSQEQSKGVGRMKQVRRESRQRTCHLCGQLGFSPAGTSQGAVSMPQNCPPKGQFTL